MVKITISVGNDERGSILVMENYVGQKQNRVANLVTPGQSKTFTVHERLNLQVMEVSSK